MMTKGIIEHICKKHSEYQKEKRARHKFISPHGENGTKRRAELPAAIDKMDRRIRSLLAERGPAVSGQNGHGHTISVANCLVVGFELPEEEAFSFLAEWNESCLPPWSEAELRRKVSESYKLGGNPGYLLNAAYSPPLSAEHQRIRDRGFTIVHDGFEEVYGEGWAPIERRQLPKVAKQLADLSDLSRLLRTEDPPEPAAGDECELKAPCRCPHSRKVFMAKIDACFGALFYFPCRKLDCDYCGPRYLEQRCSWVAFHTRALITASKGKQSDPVFIFTCNPEGLRKHARYINDKDGRFFSVHVHAQGNDQGETTLVLSTVRPKGTDAIEMDPDRGRQVICAAIRIVCRSCKARWFGHSRAWGNPDRSVRIPRGFTRIAKLQSSEDSHERVLDGYELASEIKHGSDRHWPWRARFFHYGNLSLSELAEDFSCGHKVNRADWTMDESGDPLLGDLFETPARMAT